MCRRLLGCFGSWPKYGVPKKNLLEWDLDRFGLVGLADG
jgi:hypothetical protein